MEARGCEDGPRRVKAIGRRIKRKGGRQTEGDGELANGVLVAALEKERVGLLEVRSGLI